jgi:predicted RNA-binding protein with PIN domain
MKTGPEILLVDGYNIIFAWDELNKAAAENLDAARKMLMDILSNYQGIRKNEIILVFDAYKVKGNVGSVIKYHNIHVVYTKEAETADTYIEKTACKLSRNYRVYVATSDGPEQMIILGAGALRLSAGDLLQEIKDTERHIKDVIVKNNINERTRPVEDAMEKARKKAEKRGKNEV